MPLKVFVTGASGQLGKVLIENLRRYYFVVGLYRRASDDIKADKPVFGDLKNPESFVNELANCDYVILNGALFRDAGVSPYEYFLVNSESVKKILQHLAKIKNHNVKRIVLVSTNAVHKINGAMPISENTEFGPSDFYQESKLLAEKYFLELLPEANCEGVIVRPGMIWGNGDQRLKKLFLLSKKKFIPILLGEDPWMHFITFSDLAEYIRRLCICQGINREAFLVAGKRAIRLKGLITLICFFLRKRPTFLPFPKGMLFLAADMIEPIFRFIKITPPIFRRRIYFFSKNRIFNAKKITDCCGIVSQSDLITEIYQNLREYKMIQDELEYEHLSNFKDLSYFDEINGVKLLRSNSGNIYALPPTWTYLNQNSFEMLRISPKLGIAKVNTSTL